jgi:serine/threonine protein kinase
MIIVVVVCLDRGYLSPEYASFGHISTAIDIFSFGIVILEIISGRKNIDFRKPEGQHILLQWVHINSLASNHPLWPYCGFKSLIELLTSKM